MLGNRVRVYFTDGTTIDGELRGQSAEGVWLYHGWAELGSVHFYPQHRLKEIVDLGPVYR